MQKTLIAGRPVVFDYKNPTDFLRALGEYNRKTRRGYSIRSRIKNLSGCSPALVSQVLKGQRKLKRDQLLNFAKVFALNSTEINYIDELLKADQLLPANLMESHAQEQRSKLPKNHLLANWLHPYVKDLVELKDFKLDPKWMLQRLGFAATLPKIEKSVEFLLREGFWRKDSCGKIIPEESSVVTTSEIPNEKIRDFHKQALKIAAKGLEEFTVERRKASTILVAVNSETRDELRTLIDKFENDLITFIEKHPEQKEELVQLTIHLTPVGGQNVKA